MKSQVRETVREKANRICREARRAWSAVETLDGILCPVCASSKADDEPETIVSLHEGDSCYNCFWANMNEVSK
jgi:hypothetical protein